MTDENPHQFSTQTTGGAFAQITDNTDFPHTGLIKALSLMAKGNMAVKGSATDFDITQATTGNVIQVAAGRIFKDNKLTDQVVAKNFTSSSFNTSSSGSHYHLLVVQSSDNTLQIRKQSDATVADKVPEYDEGDTIIAVIVFNSSTAALGSMQIQFLTTGKTENSLSVGRDDSGYTESLSISSNAGDVEIEAKEQDKDIVLKVNDGGASTEALRIDGATANVGIGTNAPSELLHVNGNVLIEDGTATGTSDHLLEVKSSSSGDNARFILSADTDIKLPLIHLRDVEANSGTFSTHYSAYIALDRASAIVTGSAQNDLLIANGNYNKNIHFCTNAASDGTIVTSKLTILSDGKVGIGTTTPAQELDVSGDIRLSGEIEINGNLNHDGSNIGFFGTAVASRQNVGNGSFVTNPSSFGRPTPDPNAFPGFEPSVDGYIANLENEIVTISTKLNDLIDALQLYGLIL